MKYIGLPVPVLRLVGVGLRAWWRIRRPATFGVKVLLLHPDDPGRCLIVRHSYGDRARWGLPGGAYKPERESPAHAGMREVHEELGLILRDTPTELKTVITALAGKRDTLTIVRASAVAEAFTLSTEIAEARWVAAEITGLPQDEPISRWLTLALSASAAADAGRDEDAQPAR